MSPEKNSLPIVVIFGRTNVGKSTLFNCLTEKSQALVADIDGTTRDSNIGQAEWLGKNFSLIDTGGIMDLKYLTGKKIATNDVEAKVQKQARDYLERADLILFLVDAKTGLLPQDKEMSKLLQKNLPKDKKIILVANKVDGQKQRHEASIFNKLGLGEPILISAATGSGTGDLLDIIIKKLSQQSPISLAPASLVSNFGKQSGRISDSINVAIIGKPNVGKSSLINALLGEERIIVSPIPHTTREPQDIQLEYAGQTIKLVDTAGISRQGQKHIRGIRAKKSLERLSITRSLSTLKRADIACLIIDINEAITHQDQRLVEEITKTKTSLIVIANKWDLIETRDTKAYTKHIYSEFPFARWAPIQFISALTKEKVNKLPDLILEIIEQRKTEISPNALAKFLNRIVKKHRPAKAKGTKHPRIYELKQKKINPPIFSIRIGAKDTIHFSYVRFIENRLREKFGFLGTPITICIEKNKPIHGKHEEHVTHNS
ncbi:MAG: ribosome biogenesis GTPase Der [Patescibacteria group bacterium]|nr:ribosome biogenesis GTPase Der [Patescibacteria group bacterium]